MPITQRKTDTRLNIERFDEDTFLVVIIDLKFRNAPGKVSKNISVKKVKSVTKQKALHLIK